MPLVNTASVLTITPSGYKAMMAAEPYGLFADIAKFRVAQNSMKGLAEQPWGSDVYFGPIDDYKVLDNSVILFTCVVPAEIPAAIIDVIGLYLRDGTLFAQGFLANVRNKNLSSATYIYCYTNSADLPNAVDAQFQRRSVFPQVHDYCDLPAANRALRTEYIVNNGHCGGRDESTEYLPSLLMLSSSATPHAQLYPPDEPFLNPGVGAAGYLLGPSIYSYLVTATNAAGESTGSAPNSIVLAQVPAPAAYIVAGPGNLPSATYYYQVVSVAQGGGKTTGSNEVSISLVKLAVPGAPSNMITTGGLPAGTYYYAISALSLYGETVVSPVTTVTVSADSAASLSWTAVSGAVGYSIYGRSSATPSLMNLIAHVNSSTHSFLDWGQSVDLTRAPVATDSDCGAVIKWDKEAKVDSYEIYGRVSGASKFLIAAVSYAAFSYNDISTAITATSMPLVNTTQTGVVVNWSYVPGATGYKVYGRTTSGLGLLYTTPVVVFPILPLVTFNDNGSVTPGASPPVVNSSASTLEWQMIDGTLLYRGVMSAVTSTSVTIGSPPTGTNWDLGFLTVTSGSALYQTRHVKWNGTQFILIDKPFLSGLTPATTDNIAIWAGPGCCAGACVPVTASTRFPSPPPVPLHLPPAYGLLGVHFTGNFLGQPVVDSQQTTDINFVWNATTQPLHIQTGAMDFLFCDENGKSQFNLPLSSHIVTPHGDRLPPGEYSSITESIPNAVRFTLDSIAVAPGNRLTMYSGENFTGSVVLDVIGPYYLVNYVWFDDPRFSWALDVSIWQGTAGLIIPITRRYKSAVDIREWRIGSMQITTTW